MLNNTYQYDAFANITQIKNEAYPLANGMGGVYQSYFGYDTLNRLIGTGSEKEILDGENQPVQSTFIAPTTYQLKLKYNNTGGIVQKRQHHERDQNVVPENTYDNDYGYIGGSHRLEKVADTSSGAVEYFEYDLNGNTIGHTDMNGTKQMFWDEQERLRAFYNDNNGVYQYYTYDDKGERTIKYGLEAPSHLYQNGVPINIDELKLFEFKLYPNPYVTVSSTGQYTKHYFEGSKRFASRLKDGAVRFEDPAVLYTNREAGDKAPEKTADVKSDFEKYLEKSGLGDNVSVELKETPWSPDLYYLHGDHLGTATFVTNSQAEATQFFLNLPFGETMLEQTDGSYDNPFKFNAKELDDDTGLYYYGARYYNPRLSIWYGVDPLAVYNPVMETEFYGDGQHNGGVFYWGNLNPYIYTYQNPIKYIDPNGKQTLPSLLEDAMNYIHDTKIGRKIYRWEQRNMDDEKYKVILSATPLRGFVIVPQVFQGDFGGLTTNKIPVLTRKACGCFKAGTQIFTNDGYKNIEDIVKGDLVWAFDEKTENLRLQKVLNTFYRDFSQIFKIYINDEIIEATHEHPFFIGGKWLNVDELNVGDFVTLYDGSKKRINKIELTEGNFKVYNFEVEDYHSYYVGESKILVHNGNPCDYLPISLPKDQYGKQIKGEAQLNNALKDLTSGKPVEPRLNNLLNQTQYDVSRTRNPSATQRLFDGAMEYKVDVPGADDSYRILYKASFNSRTSKWEEHIGYTYDHYITIHEVKKKK